MPFTATRLQSARQLRHAAQRRTELRQAWLFSECSNRDLDAIAAFAVPVDVEAGRVLTGEGQRARECLVVVNGHANVTRRGGVIGQVGPGFVIGMLGLVRGAPARETIAAETDMHVLVVSYQDVHAFCAGGRARAVQHRLDIVAQEQDRLAQDACDPALLAQWGL